MKAIKTSVTALYKQGLISYSPKKNSLEMIIGTNTTKYKNEYNINLQKLETFEIGVINIDGERYYSPERLFIEMGKFKLEETVKKEALRNLKKTINPELTKKYYNILKTQRRGLDNEEIEAFLGKNLLFIKDEIKETDDPKMIIREYIMALVSRNDVPVSLIKGGSSIELFTTINRTTIDIDAHIGKNSIPKIIEYLTNKNMDVYFKLEKDDIEKINKIKKQEEVKRIIKIKLIPVSKGGVLSSKLRNIAIPISFNTTYNDEEIKEIIDSYKITHRQLKKIKNANCIIFTREMLLAEKFQSLISKPENSTRSKDLIDLKLLWNEDINFKQFRKWLFRKWENQSHPLNKEDAKKVIKENKGKPLTKISNNFSDALFMYDADFTLEECEEIYNKLILESLKDE